MTWFDVVAFLLVAVIAWLESIRGFGRALVDLVGAVIIVKLAPVLAGVTTGSVNVMAESDANRAAWFAIFFVLLAVLVVLASRLIYNTTLLSLEYFDPVLGAVFGTATGLIVAFAFLHTLQISYGASESGKVLMASFAGQELLKLRSFHKVVSALTHLGEV